METEYQVKAIAADEAAEHLTSEWTEDPREIDGANWIVLMLRSEAASYRSLSSQLARRKETAGFASKVGSYCLSLRWTGDCAAVYGYAILPVIACAAMGVLLKVPVLIVGSIAILMLLFLGVGLAAHSPLDRPDGLIEAAMQRRAEEKERTSLARDGFTPEQYLATFPDNMWMERVAAAHRLGVSFDGKKIL